MKTLSIISTLGLLTSSFLTLAAAQGITTIPCGQSWHFSTKEKKLIWQEHRTKYKRTQILSLLDDISSELNDSFDDKNACYDEAPSNYDSFDAPEKKRIVIISGSNGDDRENYRCATEGTDLAGNRYSCDAMPIMTTPHGDSTHPKTTSRDLISGCNTSITSASCNHSCNKSKEFTQTNPGLFMRMVCPATLIDSSTPSTESEPIDDPEIREPVANSLNRIKEAK